MGLTVHHLNNSRSQRIIWLLEELDTTYEIKKYERHPETFLGQDDLKKLHPLARSPVLTDGKFTVAESGGRARSAASLGSNTNKVVSCCSVRGCCRTVSFVLTLLAGLSLAA